MNCRIYSVHKQYAISSEHRSEVLGNVVKERGDTVDIDIQVQDVCASSMDHVVIYMYSGRVTVTAPDLIPLFTLCERLKMKGDIKKQLLINIRRQFRDNPNMIIPYLSQAISVDAHSIKKEIYLNITKKAEKKQLKQVLVYKN